MIELQIFFNKWINNYHMYQLMAIFKWIIYSALLHNLLDIVELVTLINLNK